MTGYDIYIRYTRIMELIQNDDYTTRELSNKSNISVRYVHSIIRDLLKKDIIKIVRYDSVISKDGKPHKASVFRIIKK